MRELIYITRCTTTKRFGIFKRAQLKKKRLYVVLQFNVSNKQTHFLYYTGAVQPNEVAAPLLWNAALIDSPEPHIPRKKKKNNRGQWKNWQKNKKKGLLKKYKNKEANRGTQ